MDLLYIYYNDDFLFKLDVNKGLLTHHQTDIYLTRTEFNCLVLLISNKDSITYRCDLEKKIWPTTKSGAQVINRDSNLTQLICTLRQKISYFSSGHEVIVTMPRKGYCLNPQIKTRIESYAQDTGIKKDKFEKKSIDTTPSLKWQLFFTILVNSLLATILITLINSI